MLKSKPGLKLITGYLLVILVLLSCTEKHSLQSSHQEMILLLKKFRKETMVADNPFDPEDGIRAMDSMLTSARVTPDDVREIKIVKANLVLKHGDEAAAILLFEELLREKKEDSKEAILKSLAIAYLRQGERANCISNHAAESCILPVKGMGIHNNQSGSRSAIGTYQEILKKNPKDLESKWLMNLAYMTLGEYPKQVPHEFLIPGMEGDTTVRVMPFQDVASDLKLDVKNLAGGSIIEDFDNDGYLDIMTSGMGLDESIHFFKNNADGTFIDLSDKVGLQGISGGLNMVQADYNNDGLMDVFVLRGAWKRQYGKEPNSLLRNNGDGTFRDVTTEAGLLSFHPTQTATWNDFDNDGWVDLFIGNETWSDQAEPQSCELYMNNGNGTFREIAKKAYCNIVGYVKGVTSGDFDNDGWKDIFVSTISGQRMLMRNMGKTGEEIMFDDVTIKSGISRETGNTFPTWFWDYDNDGWLDIFTCDYTLQDPVGSVAAAEKLNIPAGSKDKMLLYRNKHDGTFTNVANEAGLNKVVFAMGSNFGDIDNDGFLDMYLGSGTPDFKALIPNKMFKNMGGKKFADVTLSARVGHLQKGHGVSFADLDNDGDQDIYIDMGGVYQGDAYQSSFFLNPGQNNNRWISLKLEGKKSNRAAIGTRVEVTFRDGGVLRTVYRDVNSGGSFGCSPMRREIGLGQAEKIDEIKIRWHGSGKVEVFHDVKPNQFLRITEGSNKVEPVNLKSIIWTLPEKICLPEIATASAGSN